MIFPEILVIVDYDGYRWVYYSAVLITNKTILSEKNIHPTICRLHGEDNVAIKRYVISFWNGVDLRYKLLQGPSVKISIAGIIISRVSYRAN